MYENGFGVAKDEQKALELYKKSNSAWSKKKLLELKARLDFRS
ncbi:MAG: SEL1-like repeat protein [Moritella sp.]|nr:SEL1-like repeat protein [Moritella sp.]NQZ41369.1 SEL1-like repeat protein [Moritella sp.]